MLCKAGNLSKRDIGSIKIQPKVTFVEISEETSATLKQLASNKKPIERHIMVRLLEKPPENISSNRNNTKRSRKGGRGLDFKKSKEDTSRDFKGKRKSERWKKSEKRKTKFSPFEDNFIEKDVILDSQDKVNKEPLSRRKKQKNDFASFEKNQRKKIKSGTLKIEKKIKTKKKKLINKASKKKED